MNKRCKNKQFFTIPCKGCFYTSKNPRLTHQYKAFAIPNNFTIKSVIFIYDSFEQDFGSDEEESEFYEFILSINDENYTYKKKHLNVIEII